MAARILLIAVVALVGLSGNIAQAWPVSTEEFWLKWASDQTQDRVRQWQAMGGSKETSQGDSKSNSTTATASATSGSRSQVTPLSVSTSTAKPPTPRPASSSSASTSTSRVDTALSGRLVPISAGSSSSGGSAQTPATNTTPGSILSAAPRATSVPTVPKPIYDAFIHLGEGPYPNATQLTSGDPQPWYESPVARRYFGGRVPNEAQRDTFSQNILQRVEQTYRQSGLDISLTSDSNAPAAHTLSVVSKANFPDNPDAIGITDIGGNGFTFIDNFGPVDSLDQLQTALAKNIAHELMHAFGSEFHDDSGKYVDSGLVPWAVLTDPQARFSPEAVAELASLDFRESGALAALGFQETEHLHGSMHCSCQHCGGRIAAQMVPEPTTIVLWSVVASSVLIRWRYRSARSRSRFMS